MGKVNVFAQKVKAQDYETFRFSDTPANQDGSYPDGAVVYAFRLRRLNEMERMAAADLGADLICRYITGGYRDQVGDWRDKPETILVDDENGNKVPLEFSAGALRLFAKIERMQGVKRDVFDDQPREDAYLFKELGIIAATTENIIPELRVAVAKIEAGVQTGPKASGAESSGQPSPQPSSPE